MTDFVPVTPPTPGIFAPAAVSVMRRVKYGDHPRLDGSVAYGQLIAAAGFMTPTVPPGPATFTPSS